MVNIYQNIQPDRVSIGVVWSHQEFLRDEARTQAAHGMSLAAFAAANPRDMVRSVIRYLAEDRPVHYVSEVDGRPVSSFELGVDLARAIGAPALVDSDITPVELTGCVMPEWFTWPEITSESDNELLKKIINLVAEPLFQVSVEPPNLAF